VGFPDPPGSTSRAQFKADVRRVVWMQACLRRRLARRELKALKAEARSVSKFKEISYRLENKVVELTQSLQERTNERKKLQTQLSELEQQLQQWVNRHEEADGKAKHFQASLQKAEAELAKRDEMLAAKADLERRLDEAIANVQEKENTIHKLTDDIIKQATQLESQKRALEAPTRNEEDSSVIMTLKNEVSNLREQLNRANALNTLTKGSRGDNPPSSPTFNTALRLGQPHVPVANGNAQLPGATPSRGHQRRHSSAGVFSLNGPDGRTSVDESVGGFNRRNNLTGPRAVSVAFNGEDNYMRGRPHGLADIHDAEDPAEEKIRLMMESKRLDEDVLDGLIRGLKIPAPSITNPPAVKEILFPANLISLVTNEMWKYGLITESERFLANVMQAIQTHVMVRFSTIQSDQRTNISCSHSVAKSLSSLASSGSPTCMRCFLSSASLRATCLKASDLARRRQSDPLIGKTTSAWYLLSNMTSTAWSTTSITLGCPKSRRSLPKWSFLP
jgi:myosin V